ncbi:hypothetical protein Rrhod_0837 [Rhodococcus rhodnii LMG 5362]|uniref:Uncharacterized protein n=1 Tax=Rhodococcus rhodnii LMG 5362 TaxID=1273125 RepID=R7WUE1_9NOCA|nr:hypothetical protein Rrhod_0837 [Rhodococcus rhodnii LMG 5362]
MCEHRWVRHTEPAPTHCGNGHPLGARRVIVGWLPCACTAVTNGGHRTHTCRTCGNVTHTPACTGDRMRQPSTLMLRNHDG